MFFLGLCRRSTTGQGDVNYRIAFTASSTEERYTRKMGDREKHLDLPPPPPFPTSVRLATLDDLPRLAFVAAAGFYHSQFFAFQRPRFNEYPKDTLANYKDQCLTHIVDPSQILLVAEADYDENEGEAVNQILRDADASAGLPEQRAGHPGKVIVGYAVILLKNDVKRIGTFQTCGKRFESLDASL